jgi:hypothetical protein
MKYELYEFFYDDMYGIERKVLVHTVSTLEEVDQFMNDFEPVHEHHWRDYVALY